MLIHKVWTETVEWASGRPKEERIKEGWFLFGFIPLFVKTITFKEHL